MSGIRVLCPLLDPWVAGAALAAPWLALGSQRDQAVFAFGVFVAAQGVHADLLAVHHDREGEVVVALLAGLLQADPMRITRLRGVRVVISKSGCVSLALCGFFVSVISTSKVSDAIQPVIASSSVRVIFPSIAIGLLLCFDGDKQEGSE